MDPLAESIDVTAFVLKFVKIFRRMARNIQVICKPVIPAIGIVAADEILGKLQIVRKHFRIGRDRLLGEVFLLVGIRFSAVRPKPSPRHLARFARARLPETLINLFQQRRAGRAAQAR